MKRKIYIFLFISIAWDFIAQSGSNKLYIKQYIKQNEIIFRIVPTSMETFDLIKNKGLLIEKTENSGTNYTEVKKLIAYHKVDTANWMRLYRKSPDKMAFVYQAIHTNSVAANATPKEKAQNTKMLYDMVLLSCDLDKEIAKACGLYFKDSLINNSKTYTYRFSVYTTGANTQTFMTHVLNASELSSDKELNSLSGKSKFNKITLQWNAKELQDNYSGYFVERSTDNISFEKVNKTPVILLNNQFEKNKTQIYFDDVMPKVNTTYYYRVKGINFFGEESQGSNVVKVRSFKPILTYPVIDSISSKNNKEIRLHWKMEDPKENELPEEYVLLRSTKENGTYTVIASGKNMRSYTDKTPLNSNYYKVGAITGADDTLLSFTRGLSLIDDTPPAIPTGLSGLTDKTGKITLKWNRNKEKDLQGYKLYRSNSLNEEFVQLNEKFITDSVFTFKTDLNNLSRYIYFKLSASDNNYNTSPRTSAICVLKTDTIKPAKPNLMYASSKLKGIECKYIKSQSDDIKLHELQRKEKTESQFKAVVTFLNKDTSTIYTDTTVVLEKYYEYVIVAIDSSDNSSRSPIIPAYFENGFREKIKEISSNIDKVKKHIVINWNYQKADIEKFVIYRKKGDEPLTIIKTIEGNESAFIDKTPNIGNIYEYRIKAVMMNGTESIISDKILVEF